MDAVVRPATGLNSTISLEAEREDLEGERADAVRHSGGSAADDGIEDSRDIPPADLCGWQVPPGRQELGVQDALVLGPGALVPFGMDLEVGRRELTEGDRGSREDREAGCG
jgi:hypothetical protein